MKILFSMHDRYGVKLLARLTLKVGKMNKHNFRRNFKDTTNLICSCSLKPGMLHRNFL